MTQIIFRATTASTIAAGGAMTTVNAQVLPQWAPPIEYIGTTAPWLVLCLTTGDTTHAGKAMKGGKVARVRAYGRSPTLHGGKECVALSRGIIPSGYSNALANVIILTYRAVGEISRP